MGEGIISSSEDGENKELLQNIMKQVVIYHRDDGILRLGGAQRRRSLGDK